MDSVDAIWELAAECRLLHRGGNPKVGSKFVSVSAPISGTDKTLSFETGKLAQQSQGAVVATIGDTVVLCTANASKSVREGTDFFPLTVNVEERAYAAGKI